MTTPRQFEANRINARASTGPRSKAGKARAGRNARRHGLSIAIASDSTAAGAAEALARHIVGDGVTPAAIAQARAFAEAQIDLDRVRKVRRHWAHQYRLGSGDQWIDWVDALIHLKWYAREPMPPVWDMWDHPETWFT
jgi:hypothetical protein